MSSLDDLQREFVDHTRVRLLEMEALLPEIATSTDRASLELLYRHFHALSGMGGTYGFDLITEIAGAAERETESRLRSGSPPSAEEVARWRAAIAGIRNAL
jgi:chemotaxis protein histidine kinase CheA